MFTAIDNDNAYHKVQVSMLVLVFDLEKSLFFLIFPEIPFWVCFCILSFWIFCSVDNLLLRFEVNFEFYLALELNF